jgi:hypothetical protein
VFRVTDGLQAEYGDRRVFDTPISEAGIVGAAVGLCFAGWRPVVELQFDAFSYPAFEQVVDHVAQSTVRSVEELRHLRAGRRPPGPPVYEALLSGAAHRVPWAELVEGLREASAALDATLGEPAESGTVPAVTAPAILVVAGPEAGSAPVIFAAELTWPEYALVQRLHFLDHRTQIRALRAALAALA